MFPYHLQEAALKVVQREEKKAEQVVLDLRSDAMRRHVLENEGKGTLKRFYDIWQERPRIVACEATTELDFSHMIHRIEHHN